MVLSPSQIRTNTGLPNCRYPLCFYLQRSNRIQHCTRGSKSKRLRQKKYRKSKKKTRKKTNNLPINTPSFPAYNLYHDVNAPDKVRVSEPRVMAFVPRVIHLASQRLEELFQSQSA